MSNLERLLSKFDENYGNLELQKEVELFFSKKVNFQEKDITIGTLYRVTRVAHYMLRKKNTSLEKRLSFFI